MPLFEAAFCISGYHYFHNLPESLSDLYCCHQPSLHAVAILH